MSFYCKVRFTRKKVLLLVLVTVLMVAIIVTYHKWRPADPTAFVQTNDGNHNKRLGLEAATNLPIRSVSDEKKGDGRSVFNDLKVSISDRKTSNGEKDKRIVRNCQPKSNVVFLKTHKTASSTVQNILMRYGLARNLTFALPYPGRILSHHRHFSKSNVLQEQFLGNRTAYNILCHHMRFHYDSIRDLMPKDTVYVTIVRNPVDIFESSFEYFGFGPMYNISQPNALETFLDNPSYYVRKFGEIPHSHNSMFYDLGYNNRDLTSQQTIKSIIEQLDRIFSVVLVSDYFEESIILLKHALCWDIDDVTFFKLNSRSEKSVHHVTADMARKILHWNKADAMLFDHYNKTLWSNISRLSLTWKNEVQKLKERNLELRNACLESGRVTMDEVEKEFKVFQPNGISMNGFVLKDSAKKNTTCRSPRRQSYKRPGTHDISPPSYTKGMNEGRNTHDNREGHTSRNASNQYWRDNGPPKPNQYRGARVGPSSPRPYESTGNTVNYAPPRMSNRPANPTPPPPLYPNRQSPPPPP
ncbi:PREDICTED: galactosylceramide sulfotransferase-like [Branchiostoma belcheri]|uniref:Galactosylceramide sulfotransferase-like n=1 Tax=Branchiostoma belcheri TaxID=7741 RepID=A0A6P4ZBW4_BRABE|nr:PREDICTED: galactosylceramide sulfotransferase-like [Branchiostoma belcheri]